MSDVVGLFDDEGGDGEEVEGGGGGETGWAGTDDDWAGNGGGVSHEGVMVLLD